MSKTGKLVRCLAVSSVLVTAVPSLSAATDEQKFEKTLLGRTDNRGLFTKGVCVSGGGEGWPGGFFAIGRGNHLVYQNVHGHLLGDLV